MTEDTGSTQSLGIDSALEVNSNIESVQPQKAERVFTRGELAKIVDKQRMDAVEEYKNSQSRTSSSPYVDDIQKLVEESTTRALEKQKSDAQEKVRMEEGQRIADEIFNKISSVKDKYSDFGDKLKSVPIDRYANVFELANMVPNTADVLYSLMSRPTKLSEIRNLANDSKELALQELNRLAKSIQENEEAKNIKLPNSPLSQMRPTKNAVDSGKMTVRDYREYYRTNVI